MINEYLFIFVDESMIGFTDLKTMQKNSDIKIRRTALEKAKENLQGYFFLRENQDNCQNFCEKTFVEVGLDSYAING